METAKIIILVGESGTGKDTVLHELSKRSIDTHAFVSTTTRPMRENETDGVDYYFVNEAEFQQKIKNNDFVEYRSYNTNVSGKQAIWYYGSHKITIDPKKTYAIVLDLEGAQAFAEYYGKKNCYVVYLTVPGEVRRKRAENRGSFDETEWERRLADDKVKYAPENVMQIADCAVNNIETVERTADKICKSADSYFATGTKVKGSVVQNKQFMTSVGKIVLIFLGAILFTALLIAGFFIVGAVH